MNRETAPRIGPVICNGRAVEGILCRLWRFIGSEPLHARAVRTGFEIMRFREH